MNFGAFPRQNGSSAYRKCIECCTLELPANNSMQIQLHLHSFAVPSTECSAYADSCDVRVPSRRRKAMKYTLAICQIYSSREIRLVEVRCATDERCLRFEKYKQCEF